MLIASHAHSQNAVEYYNKGNVQFQYQNYEEAIRLLTRAIAIKPDYADAYIMRGDANYFLKQFDKAIADYTEDDKLKKGRSGYNMACAYAQLGKKDEAFKALESNLSSEHKLRWSIVTSDPDLETLRSDVRWQAFAKKAWYTPYETAVFDGDTKMSANDPAGSISDYTKAISIDPVNWKAYSNRAISHIRTGDLQKSLQDLNEAIKLKPLSMLYGNRGYVENKLGDKQASLDDYEKAVQLDPSNLVYYDLGIARYMAGNKTGALEAVVKHMDYFTKDEMGYYFGGIVASETERFNEALDYFNKAIAINSEVSQFYMKRADVYFLQKKYTEAVTDYSKVIELDPAGAEAYYIRGNAKASLMDREGACADWKKASELGFEDPNGYIRDLCK